MKNRISTDWFKLTKSFVIILVGKGGHLVGGLCKELNNVISICSRIQIPREIVYSE